MATENRTEETQAECTFILIFDAETKPSNGGGGHALVHSGPPDSREDMVQEVPADDQHESRCYLPCRRT